MSINKRNVGISAGALILFVLIFGLLPTLIIAGSAVGLAQLPMIKRPELNGPAFGNGVIERY
jgi:hypothetical protein